MTKTQHFLVINSAAHEKPGLMQLFIKLLDIVKSKSYLAVPRCVTFFFSTEVVFISPTAVNM